MNKPIKRFNTIRTTRFIRSALASGYAGPLTDAELHNDAAYAFNGRTVASWVRVFQAITRARIELANRKQA